MRTRGLIGAALGLLALSAAALMVAEVAIYGNPALVTVLVTAILVGSAAAWPVASRPVENDMGPGCMECGYASWASAEMGFCIHCGSKKVWTRERLA